MAVLQQISRWAIRTLRQLGYLEAGIDAAMLAHAARADLCWRLGRTADTSASYQRALALARQEPERRFLASRLRTLG